MKWSEFSLAILQPHLGLFKAEVADKRHDFGPVRRTLEPFRQEGGNGKVTGEYGNMASGGASEGSGAGA